jgi:hypothetical protein
VVCVIPRARRGNTGYEPPEMGVRGEFVPEGRDWRCTGTEPQPEGLGIGAWRFSEEAIRPAATPKDAKTTAKRVKDPLAAPRREFARSVGWLIRLSGDEELARMVQPVLYGAELRDDRAPAGL